MRDRSGRARMLLFGQWNRADRSPMEPDRSPKHSVMEQIDPQAPRSISLALCLGADRSHASTDRSHASTDRSHASTDRSQA